MTEYIAVLCDELGDDFRISIQVPDLVENVTQYVREQYPESLIVFVVKKGLEP